MSARPGATVLAVLFALAGAAVLERRASARFDQEGAALRSLEDLRQADLALDDSILELRAGMLKDFDWVVRDVRFLQQAAAAQRSFGVGDPDSQHAEIDQLVVDVGDKVQHVEAFKTDLSLFWNSSLHFPTAAAAFARLSDPATAPLVDALRTNLARYSTQPSKELAEHITHDLDAVDGGVIPTDAPAIEARRSTLGHARTILERRARLDDLVRDIRRSPVQGRILRLEDLHFRRKGRALVVVAAARTVLVALGLLIAAVLVELARVRRYVKGDLRRTPP